MDFVFWAHFITTPYHVEPFNMVRAIVLVGLVFVVGLVFATVGGLIRNRLAVMTSAPAIEIDDKNALTLRRSAT